MGELAVEPPKKEEVESQLGLLFCLLILDKPVRVHLVAARVLHPKELANHANSTDPESQVDIEGAKPTD
jgi:hypothetical protein